jgi:microcystin-dependent protein
MAKDAINEYSSTAASNTDVGGVNLGEGTMVVSDINDSIRELMSHLAEFSDGTHGIQVLNLEDDDGSASIKIQAPSDVTTTTTFTLPDGDGTAGAVLETNGSGTLSWGTGMPSGVVMPFAGTSAPSGYLFCYGQTVAAATYPDLFTAIGTTYGGDSTNFTLPDLRGRTVAGQDDMGGSSANRLTSPIDGDTLGAAGGTESHTLTTAQLPSHTHSLGTRSRVQVGTDNGVQYGGGGSSTFSGAVINTQSTGSGNAHNNVQPTIILNYIIKT